MGRGWMELHGAQDLGKLGRAEFAGSAGSVAVARQTYLGHGCEVKRDVCRAVPPRDTQPAFGKCDLW